MNTRSIEASQRPSTRTGVACVDRPLVELASSHRPDSTEPGIDTELRNLQRKTLRYFVHEANLANGSAIDETAPDRLVLFRGAMRGCPYRASGTRRNGFTRRWRQP
ncbi:hypothetical protein [Variovorax paradoxus]|uniref:hypothetical protein n=1 Tax=Variovorax paradoxus TaxID=34073 RepID=UPI0012DA3EE8|nr:hypothetical protein [Variovorax paradoxus]